MRERIAGLGYMANSAFVQCARVSLQIDEFHSIPRLAALGNGMRTVVAGLAVDTAVTGGLGG